VMVLFVFLFWYRWVLYIDIPVVYPVMLLAQGGRSATVVGLATI